MAGHSDRDHAALSPSASKRWLSCTPSAMLEKQFPDVTSEAAAEGTLCHELCEGKLLCKFEQMTKRKLSYLIKKCKENPLWKDEMEGTSSEYVEKIYSDALGFSVMPMVLAEQKLDLTEWIPDGFGTGDCILIGDDQLNIYDYKHGKGVPVYAEHNPQMMIYALGALKAFGWMADIKRVKMCIIQPRLNSITEFEMPVEDLQKWGEEELKPLAEKASKGEGELVPGEHCRFCKAKAQCRARAEIAFGLKDKAGLIPPLITAEEAGEFLKVGEIVASWLSDLKEWALSEILNGADVPGWKAVEGKSTRKFSDQEKAFEVLMNNEVPRALLYETKPITLAAAEKVVGAKVFAELCGDYIVKPPGKPALVPESDKRQAIRTSAEEAFGSLEQP